MEPNNSAGGSGEARSLPLEMKLWRLAEIIAAARKIHSSLTLDNVLSTFLNIATGEVGASESGVFLGSAGEEMALAYSRFSSKVEEKEHVRRLGLARDAARNGRIIEEAVERGASTVVSVPLLDEAEASIGVLQILRKTGELDESDRLFLRELAHFASLSIKNAKYHEDSVAKARLDTQIGVARDIQVGTLPTQMPEIAGYDVAGLSRPADETSGDSFDLIGTGEKRLTVLLADATGHGIGPALSVTQVRSMLRVASRLQTPLGEIVRNINNQLHDDLASNRFVTAFFGQLDAEANRIHYYSAGQAPIIVFRAASGEAEMLGASCPPLGILPMTAVAQEQVLEFAPGDTLALVTDGVFEAEDSDEEMFGKDAVVELLRETGEYRSARRAEALLEAVDEHRRSVSQSDDITIVLVRRDA